MAEQDEIDEHSGRARLGGGGSIHAGDCHLAPAGAPPRPLLLANGALPFSHRREAAAGERI